MNATAVRFLEALHSQRPVRGLTHNFYRYPARFPPELAHEVIQQFSSPGDWFFDPFMGGGTSIVEALALGRMALGIDINSLAHFVTCVKTTPLSPKDHVTLREWAVQKAPIRQNGSQAIPDPEATKHLPIHVKRFLTDALASVEMLEYPRQQRFARCALLRSSQSVLDCHDSVPSRRKLEQRLSAEVDRMLQGLDDWVTACQNVNVPKSQITSRRILIKRSVIGSETDKRIECVRGQPRLVFTSPPYPGVHVLYHRWQIAGRKETSVPYWICNLNDGRTGAYYTFGGRSLTAQQRYFETLTAAFESVSRVIHREAVIVQLVGFSDIETQLPAYLSAMKQAGYMEIFPLTRKGQRLWREIPNRRWYAREQDEWDAAREVLLFHAPSEC